MANAEVIARAKRKASSGQTDDSYPAHNFLTLLSVLSTLTLNRVSLPGIADATLPMLSDPTLLQARVLELLGFESKKKLTQCRHRLKSAAQTRLLI